MRQLPALNPQTFFCECGLGPADNCPAFHVVQEMTKPNNRTRQIILAIIFAAICTAIFGRL